VPAPDDIPGPDQEYDTGVSDVLAVIVAAVVAQFNELVPTEETVNVGEFCVTT